MRVVLWIGNDSNQKALANKFHEKFPITAIVRETKRNKRRITIRKIFEGGIEKIFLNRIRSSWFGMLDFYNTKFPFYPQVPLLDIANINSDEVYEFTKNIRPDLIIVSGTRLIKEKLLSLKPTLGILNLHTGLSPYIKGGPNCTNWCISTKQPHLIGNTVMWIDKNIDTGNIMTTEFTELTGNELLGELHIKVMEHAHDLYIRSAEMISLGKINNVAQKEIAEGHTYYNREWRLNDKIRLLKNMKYFKKEFQLNRIAEKRKKIITVPLPL